MLRSIDIADGRFTFAVRENPCAVSSRHKAPSVGVVCGVSEPLGGMSGQLHRHICNNASRTTAVPVNSCGADLELVTTPG